ncbi:hypothetical protein ABZ468_34920 [Streptomyces sp. NPDC005708]|uniref:hypothetical protein n=1 Tax=Streptomyces sp. NPDC005708 TaxID=3154564 RepID=UPI0033DBF51D
MDQVVVPFGQQPQNRGLVLGNDDPQVVAEQGDLGDVESVFRIGLAVAAGGRESGPCRPAPWTLRLQTGRLGSIEQVRSPAKGPITVLSSRPTGACHPSCAARKDSVISMADETAVVGGVDTHTDFHQAAVIDSIGRPAPGHSGLFHHTRRLSCQPH